MRRRWISIGAVLVLILAACHEETPAATPPSTTSPTTTAATTAPETTTTSTTTTTITTLPEVDLDYVPPEVDADNPCLDRAVFGDPADSEYVLPFAIGEEYLITQSYCFQQGGHREQLAYDFNMPVGDDVLAARAGVVVEVKQDSPDDGRGHGRHNYVYIRHEDGTIAFYAHLRQDHVYVEWGQSVEAGEPIADSGNSGMTGGRPHLHFGVYEYWPPTEGRGVPVNFRNAEGPLDPRRGLMFNRVYEALPWDDAS